MQHYAMNDFKLLQYFNLDSDINVSWRELLKDLKADIFSGNTGLGKFTRYFPEYVGNNKVNKLDSSMFYVWGINYKKSDINDAGFYIDNKDFSVLDSIDEIKRYDLPTLSNFNFNCDSMKLDLSLKKEYFLGTGYFGSIFMISMYLRGIKRLMIELLTNKRLAKYYIDRIGEFSYEFTKLLLSKIAKDIDFYAIWDDLAMQDGLMIPYKVFREFYLPWYKKIFAVAKKYDLITYFHICGNANEIIPDLIDIGVDILDPVQTSARDMDLKLLKARYGKDICFHGGIDVQKMLPFDEPGKIKNYVRKIKELFGRSGGIILGPSHSITSDVSVENILAVYNAD